MNKEAHPGNWEMQKVKLSKVVVPAVLLVSVVFLFHGVIFPPKPLYGSDFELQFYPWKKFIYEELWSRGSIPFWNPYVLSGTPFIANIQASMFYPLGFLYYLLPPEWAYLLSTILHFMLGSTFMYGFMRGICLSPVASLFSALVFVFNGFALSHLYAGHLSFLQNYIWIPLVFYFLHCFTQDLRMVWAVGAGLILGVQILGGFPQIAFYTILGSLGFIVFHGFPSLKARAYATAYRTGIGLILFLVIGFGIAAVQVLPTLEFTTLSTRSGGVSYAMATYDSLHPKELLAFLIPDIFGNAVDRTYWRSQEIWHFWETCGYVGMLPLLLFLVKVEVEPLRRIRLFFCLTAGCALFLAFGRHNPLYPLMYHLPGFNSFRIPAQILFLYVFSLAAISGIVIERLRKGTWKFSRPGIVVSVFVGSVLVLFSAGSRLFPFKFFLRLFRVFGEGPVTQTNLSNLYPRISLSIEKSLLLFLMCLLLLVLLRHRRIGWRAFGVLTAAILVFDLFSFGKQFIRPAELSYFKTGEQLIAHMPGNPSRGRVVTGGKVFSPNDGLKYRFPSIQGYDPLLLKSYVHFFQASQGYPIDDHVVNLEHFRDPEAKLLKLLHVRKAFLNQGMREIDNAIPYAHVVASSAIKPFKEILSFMKGVEYDPAKTVVLEPSSILESKLEKNSEPLVSSCSVTDYQNEHIGLKVSTNQAGYLVLSEISYPGWQATVDGRKVGILRGNYMFRVIVLKEGEHDVCLRFISWPFRAGAILSLLTFAISLGVLMHGRRRQESHF